MLIYRVETECGLGAYNCGAAFAGSSRPNSPVPSEDPKLDWYEDDREWSTNWGDILFAFESIEAFRKWFNGYEIESLVSVGCKLSVYEADVYRLGSYQCVFDPERARLLERPCLSEVYNGVM